MGYNHLFAPQPDAVVFCADTQEVVDAVSWARHSGVPLRVRSGRHCLEGCSPAGTAWRLTICSRRRSSWPRPTVARRRSSPTSRTARTCCGRYVAQATAISGSSHR
nr:FAD-binding protein [Mycobacterium sp. 852014-52144_SCH5372336]